MRSGTTSSGFKFKIDEVDLNDMEFIELMAEAEENPLKYPKMVERMLGKEQKQKLYDHVRTKEGRVPPDTIDKEVEEIFILAGEDAKNSESSPA
jgi:hypothetical protein